MKTNLKNFPMNIWCTKDKFQRWRDNFEAELREYLATEERNNKMLTGVPNAAFGRIASQCLIAAYKEILGEEE